MLIFSDFLLNAQFIVAPFLAVLIGLSCAQRVPSYRERSSRRNRDDSTSGSQKQPSNRDVATERELPKRSEMSQKSQRKANTTDSIKILRGRKPQRKSKDPKEMKPERSDSTHTVLINVPLGKAANETPSPSNLTDKSKAAANKKGSEEKVKFADQLVKNSKTPTKEAPPPPPQETSKKSKRSLKGAFSKKSSRKSKAVRSK